MLQDTGETVLHLPLLIKENHQVLHKSPFIAKFPTESGLSQLTELMFNEILLPNRKALSASKWFENIFLALNKIGSEFSKCFEKNETKNKQRNAT